MIQEPRTPRKRRTPLAATHGLLLIACAFACACVGTACAQQQPAAALPPSSPPAHLSPPAFQASGPQIATAPSGYSDGATTERSHAALELIPALQQQVLLELLSPFPRSACSSLQPRIEASLLAPNNFAARQALGFFYLQHGQPELALPSLQSAHLLQPADQRTQIALTIAAMQTKQFSAAAVAIDLLASEHAQPATVAVLRGALLAVMAHPTDAIAAYKAAMPSQKATPSPAEDSARFALGLELLAQSALTPAHALFAAGVHDNPRSARLWLGLGLAELLSATPAAASVDFLHASRLNPADLVSSTLLAVWIESTAPEAADAVAALEHAAVLFPDSPLAQYNAASLLARTTRAHRSTAETAAITQRLDRAIIDDPHFAAAYFELGLVAAEAKDVPSAIAAMQHAVQLRDDLPDWHYRLFREYEAARQPDRANRELTLFKHLHAANAEQHELLPGITPSLWNPDTVPCTE